MYFFDVMQPIELLPGMCIGLSCNTYYSYRNSLVSQEDKGWFLVQKAFCLPVGEALGFSILPNRVLRGRLRSWFPGRGAKGPSPGSGIYVAVEPTMLPVGAQVELTPEKAFAWQFYLKEVGSEAFEVRKGLPCAPGEWVRCCAGMKSLPQQWIQLTASSFAEISREKLFSSEELACQVYYVKESETIPPGWMLRLSRYQVGRYSMVANKLEPLKEPWYRTTQPFILERGDLIGINQGGVPEGLSVFEVPKESSESLLVGDERILGSLLKESGAMTLTHLGRLMPDCHRRGLLRQLQRLMDQGQVLRQGQGRSTVYQWHTVDKSGEGRG